MSQVPPDRTVIRETSRFVLVSYALIVAHLSTSLLGTLLPLSVHAGIMVGACMVSSAVFVVRLSDRLSAINSRLAKTIASMVVLPGWLVLFLVESAILMRLAGL